MLPNGTGWLQMQDNQREEIIYLAGLFDGEGTICIQRDVRLTDKETGRYKGATYTVTVRIGMIERHAIEMYLNVFKVGYLDCEKTYHKFRPMWRYSIRRREDVKFFIENISPFLRVKKPQAELALEYFKLFPKGHGYRSQGEKIWNEKEEFRIKMSSLNGVKISPATTKRRGRSPSVRVSDSLIS
jgi:hypothetical protein